ncbi:MAG: SUMF1/EgtB/PvdO family nonheme iron enzyme, partial [Bdellovibrionales bacterium]|nr:SUMF1/EgtB/PvdO family nonheme iron enzyme [Bdellovibrionales bacterium]
SCGKTNNRNKFKSQPNDKAKFDQAGGCEQSLSCPEGTQLVCSKKYATKVCIDTDLKQSAEGLPEGNFSYHKCQSYCQSRGMRLPTNNEWLLAAAGSEAKNCLYPQVTYPIKKGARMDDLAVNAPLKEPRKSCVSLYKIKDMVGVLGQWVEGTFKNRSGHTRGQFNGGLWPQKASTVFYRTVAHGPGYSDYSIGCRCASDPR